MTSTPPLASRVVRFGLVLVAITLLVVNAAVFLVFRDRLYGAVEDLLTARVGLVGAEAEAVQERGGGPADLAAALQERGLRVSLRTPDGEVLTADPTSPTVGPGLPGRRLDQGPGRTRAVQLDGGLEAEVYASTAGVSDALHQLILLQVAASLLAMGLATLLLGRAARRVLAPVAEITAAATRTADGNLGERLRPDRPQTDLGQMATAYDNMLDALESRLQAERDAAEARALLAAVVNGSTDAIAVQDLDGKILTWNGAAENIFGWPADQAIGRQVSLVVPVEALPKLSSLVAGVVADGDVRTYEGEWLARDGRCLPMSVRLSPVRNDDGQIVAVATGARDVTEQRWLASTLESTLAALKAAAEEAEAAEVATRRFLADAAHQLRTPMAGIGACAETLLRGPSAEDADRLLVTMVRETSRAARLIASLLRMARLDQGLPLTSEPVDVVALGTEEVERLNLLSPGLHVELAVTDESMCIVPADRAACREILSNLGDNARRHARKRIDLVIAVLDHEVHLRMVDDGPGLAGAARETAFERFVSLDGQGGSGLGLPIGRALAIAMGGDLRYDAGFVLSLPMLASSSVR